MDVVGFYRFVWQPNALWIPASGRGDLPPPPLPRRAVLFRGWMLTVVAGALAGCATYAPKPLGNGHGIAHVTHLSVPAASMPTRALAGHRFDPEDGLDVTEVAMLAVADNPQLKIKRDELGIAGAEAFAAGLLPDPQLTGGVEFPTGSGNGLTKAFNLGLSQDIGALLTRSSRVAAARHHRKQVNLDLLWAEWQTVARARTLFEQLQFARAREQQLQREALALTPLHTQIRKALGASNLTYAVAATGLDAVASVRSQLAQATRQRIGSGNDLRLLLGLAPGAPLHLVGAACLTTPTAAQLQRALATLPERRPDLLALQAGYAAQEANVRGAILAQFPSITFGFTRTRDTSNVTANGFNIGVTLPLFNRNRGNIAIARATRQRLHDAYAARLFGARSDMLQLQENLASLRTQIDASSAHMRALDAARTAAAQAWQANLLDWTTYLTIRTSALAADLQWATLRQQRAQQAIALETLLGGDWNTDSPTCPRHATTNKAQAESPHCRHADERAKPATSPSGTVALDSRVGGNAVREHTPADSHARTEDWQSDGVLDSPKRPS